MHFGFALELSDIDLWNINLLDTHLDLLSPDKYADIPSKYFVCLLNIFKTSWRHIFKTSRGMSSRHLQGMSSRRLQDISSRRLQDFFSVTIFRLPRCLGRRKIVTLKTSWRPTNVCWFGMGTYFAPSSLFTQASG